MVDLISLAVARQLVRKAANTLVDLESVSLLEVLGRRLAQECRADTPWPSTDRSAMDGYGVRAGAKGLPAQSELQIVGVCRAGHPFDGAVVEGQAVQIMTGAVVPNSVDAVVPVENTSGYAPQGEMVRIEQSVTAGDCIRAEGSEVAQGDLLLALGTRIRAAHVGSLAVLGVDPVPVFRRPVVAILATGDEVVPIEQQPEPHQVRNSNAYALAAQVQVAGGQALLLGISPDDEPGLRELIGGGLEKADILLTIGGVSKGTHDLVHGLLKESGVDEIFHGVALKPGKPVFFGCRQDAPQTGVTGLPKKTYVFGLPGNPASAFTVFDLLVRPLLAWLTGDSIDEGPPLIARVAGQPFRPNWRTQAVPARLTTDAAGSLVAELGSAQPSGNPFGLLHGEVFALIPPNTECGEELSVPLAPYSDRA